MSDSARKNQRKTRRGCRRNRTQAGGGLGAGYSVGGPVVPGLPIGNTSEIVSTTNCRAVTPDYAITPPAATGLPGFGKMMGGAYTFNLGSMSNPNGAALGLGAIPEVMKVGCQGTITNPLNNGPHTASNPTPGATNNWDTAASITKGMVQAGGVGQVDSPFYTAPTAGFANTVSTWKDSVGGPVQLQMPYDAKIMNPACVKTGGRRRSGSKRRGSKRRGSKSKKARKASRRQTGRR
jgi:hypothetical protein